MKTRSRTDEWSRRTVRRWLVHIPDHIFSEDERAFMVLKYTETGNVLETIKRFQRQFPNQRTSCRRTITDNYNKYVQYGFSLNRNVGNIGSSCSETINTCSSTKNRGLGCAPAIFVQFFCFLLHSSVPVLSFTYLNALELFQNTLLCNTCDHPFV